MTALSAGPRATDGTSRLPRDVPPGRPYAAPAGAAGRGHRAFRLGPAYFSSGGSHDGRRHPARPARRVAHGLIVQTAIGSAISCDSAAPSEAQEASPHRPAPHLRHPQLGSWVRAALLAALGAARDRAASSCPERLNPHRYGLRGRAMRSIQPRDAFNRGHDPSWPSSPGDPYFVVVRADRGWAAGRPGRTGSQPAWRAGRREGLEARLFANWAVRDGQSLSQGYAPLLLDFEAVATAYPCCGVGLKATRTSAGITGSMPGSPAAALWS